MGTIPVIENMRLSCRDGTVARIEATTTTDDMMLGSDGSVCIQVDVVGETEVCLYLALDKFSDVWMARFCDALVDNPEFRATLPDFDYIDRMVIPAAPARDDGRLTGLIRKGRNAKFKDYVGVRSGRDRYSTMKLPVLEAEAGERACSDLDSRMLQVKDEHRAAERTKVLRWFLRGMPMAMAFRKVEVDREVTANVVGRATRR